LKESNVIQGTASAGGFSVRKVVLLVLGAVVGIGFLMWDRQGSEDAIRTIADEMGLQMESNGRRHTARGNVDGIGVTIKTTFENLAGETQIYTDLILHVPGAPPGRIFAENLRRRMIESFSGDQQLVTGDAAFDEAVVVVGPADQMLAHLSSDARSAIRAAVEKGWALKDGSPWQAREAGYMGNVNRMRSLLEVGLAAARTSRVKGDWRAALQQQAASDPEPGVRAAAEVALHGGPAPASVAADQPLDLETASEALQDPDRAFDAALLLANAGDDRLAVRQALMQGLQSTDRQAEAIDALARVGDSLDIAMLRLMKGEHEAAAQAAIAAIEATQ
jgi:hypothetical protein